MNDALVIEYLQGKLVELEGRGEIVLQDALHEGASAIELDVLQEDINEQIQALRSTINYLGGL